MRSNGSSFETILEALVKQKQVLENLQAEHETLRQQLSELRKGHGIYVEILGVRIPLVAVPGTEGPGVDEVRHGDTLLATMVEDTAPVLAAVPAAADASLQETTAIAPAANADLALQQTTAFIAPANDLALQQTTSISGEVLQAPLRETPQPGVDFLIEDVAENDSLFSPTPSSSFLEEALFAEFSTDSNRHVGNWTGPNTSGPLSNGPITNNPDLDEDEKAALRRALNGSYILE